MSFVVSAKVLMDGAQAIAELKSLKSAKESVTKANTALNQVEAKTTTAIKANAAAVKKAVAQANALAAAEQSVAREAFNAGNSTKIAAGQIGNLTAQFNDIGVMMAAGQNPFQLAIQQGTQISQVIGPMGAAGAVKSLKAGLMGMVNPISIITIVSIAAAAAMSNWLTGADEDADTLEDTLEAMGSAIDLFATKAKESRLSTAEMIAEFGSASPALQAVLTDMAALAKMDAYKAIDQTSASVRDLVLDLGFMDDRSSASAAQDFLGLYSIRKSARAAGAEFANNLELLNNTVDPAKKLQVALDLRDMLLQASDGLEGLNTGQRDFYEGLANIIRDMELLNGKVVDHETQQANALQAKTVAAYAYYGQTRAASDDQIRSGEEMLAQLVQENALIQAQVQFGQDSAEVTQLRQAAEQAAYEETLATLSVSEDLKDQLRAAFEEGQKLAELDMTPGINGATEAAARLVDQLGVSAELAAKLAGLGLGHSGPNENTTQGYEAEDPRAPQNNRPGVWTGGYSTSVSTPKKSKGSGASQIDAERQAIEQLIARQQEQLDILRETDPVMQEMIRHRDTLEQATDAEREAVEDLIRERLNEQQAIEQTQLASDFLSSNIETLAEGMAAGGDSAAAAWEQVEAAIISAALQAALLGEGPWADLFGLGGDSGGLTGLIMSGIGLADGGTVYGSGGNKDDKVPAWLSPGETVVTAKATRQFRPLLQAMNDGVDIPGLAEGGTIGGATTSQSYSGLSSSGAAASQSSVLLRILPSPLFQTVVEEQTQGIVIEAVDDYDRNRAPDTVKRTIDDPRRRG